MEKVPTGHELHRLLCTNKEIKEKEALDICTKLTERVTKEPELIKCFGLLIQKTNCLRIYDMMCRNLFDLRPHRTANQAFRAIITEIATKNISDIIAPIIINSILKDLIEDLENNFTFSISIIELLFKHFSFIIHNNANFANTFFFDNYQWFCTGQLLGEGTFAKVFLGYNTSSSKKVAFKIMSWQKIKMRPKLEELILNEITTLTNLKNRHIIKLYNQFTLDDKLILILEYCEGGDLRNYMKTRPNQRLSESDVINGLKQLAVGFKYLRDHDVVHRDIKPDNILLKKKRNSNGNEYYVWKLADFTFTRHLSDNEFAESVVGSPLYLAPEISNRTKYTDKVEVWSLGMTIYFLLVGDTLFGNDLKCGTTLDLVKQGTIFWPVGVVVSDGMQNLLSKMLVVNVQMRMSFADFFMCKMLGLDLVDREYENERRKRKEDELQILRRELEVAKQKMEAQKKEADEELDMYATLLMERLGSIESLKCENDNLKKNLGC